MKRTIRILLPLVILLACVAVAQYAVYYDRLPERVASKFSGDGRAVSWTSRDALFGIYGGTVALFLSLFWLVRFMVRLPPRWINLPRKEYWLAAERRAATIATLEDQLKWFLAVTLGYLILVMQLVLRANFANPPQLQQQRFWLYFVLYIGYAIGWTVWLIVRFYRVPRRPADQTLTHQP